MAIMAKSRTTRPKLRNSILPKVGGTSARQEPAEVLAPLVIRMAGYAESQLEQSITAAVRRNAAKAIAVAGNDSVLDDLQTRINREAQQLLIDQRPDQADLNQILGAMRIAGDLERIGDYAANIAKRVRPLAEFADLPQIGAVSRMGRLVRDLLSSVVTAYSRNDLAGAIEAWHRDEDLDDLYTSLHREVLTYMMEDPRNITGYIHILFIAKNVERIGDHATNIAEMVHLIVTGEPFNKVRPTGDDTSDQLIRPADRDKPAGAND